MTLPMQVRTIVQQEMHKALSNFDALISPAAPTTAYKLGHVKDDPLEMYKGDIMTINVNLAGEDSNAFCAQTMRMHRDKRDAACAHGSLMLARDSGLVHHNLHSGVVMGYHGAAQACRPSRFQLGLSRVQMGGGCLSVCRSLGKHLMKEISSELHTSLSRQLTLHVARLQYLAPVRVSRVDRCPATYNRWYFTSSPLSRGVSSQNCLPTYQNADFWAYWRTAMLCCVSLCNCTQPTDTSASL